MQAVMSSHAVRIIMYLVMKKKRKHDQEFIQLAFSEFSKQNYMFHSRINGT